MTNDQSIFISWSGQQAQKYAEYLKFLFKKHCDQAVSIFYSGEIENGAQWLSQITKALKGAKYGLIILTRENLHSAWLNFEAGAIYKGYEGEQFIIPIFVDISPDDLSSHPLSFFQSRYCFTYDSIIRLIQVLSQNLGWSYSDNSYSKNEFASFLAENSIKSDLVCERLFKEKVPIYNNKNSGFVAEVSESLFWEIRHILIKQARGELIISGQSLDEAFSEKNETRSIINDIIYLIHNNMISRLKIVLTDLTIFNNINHEILPENKLKSTQSSLLRNIFPICEQKKCRVDVYFIPLLQIDHAIISDQYLAFRSTKLWTSSEAYKGGFVIYSKTGNKNSDYCVHKRYLEKLMDTSTTIDLDIDSRKSNSDPLATSLQKDWRLKIKNKSYQYVFLHKLYHSQLISYIENDWEGSSFMDETFIHSKDIKSIEDLFSPQKLLNDPTQKLLLPFIHKTQELLNQLIEKYDTSTILVGANECPLSGARIYPSLDLGMPNNIQRLAGGFATGMLVTWRCGTPIIPVDATVNVCSSSVFKLAKGFQPTLSSEDFCQLIKKTISNATTSEGYSFSFDSGNHFLMIAEDKKSKDYYLVLHSSAMEFKDSYMGLYPVEDNWYNQKIRTFPSSPTDRYLRYIKDEDAKYFISLAHKLEGYNKQIHEWFAKKLNCTLSSFEKQTYHHYYMPTDSSIAIGTFVEEPGTIVPIFSDVGKPICLFEIGKDNWKINLDGKEVCLVPHGWGQQSNGISEIEIDYDDGIVRLAETSYKIDSIARITDDQKQIRAFSSQEEFLAKGNQFLKGKVVSTLYPIYLYCKKKKGKIGDV